MTMTSLGLVNKFRQLKEELAQQLSDCLKRIQNVQVSAQLTYTKIGEKLPEIIHQIESDYNEASALISFFITGGEEDFEKSVVGQEIEDSRKRLTSAATLTAEMRRLDQALLKEINVNINTIKKLHHSIHEISLISEDIELLSYNAGFVAGRVGSAGSAFMYIAREIKKLSNHTRKLVERMQVSTKKLVHDYNWFSERIQDIGNKADSELKHIDKKLTSAFNRYETGLQTIANILLESLRRTESAKKRVPDIMVSLQLQDILHQSLDSLIKANEDIVKAVQQKNRKENPDADENERVARIDESTAKIAIYTRIALDLNRQIYSRAKETVTKTREYMLKLREELEDIEQEKSNLIDFFAKKQSELGYRSSIELIFDESVEVMRDMLEFLENTIVEKRNAHDQGKVLLENMQDIQSCFDSIEKVIKNFTLIKVASKMEIARDEELSRNITASSEMFEELTVRMEQLLVGLRSGLKMADKSINQGLEQLEHNLLAQVESVARVRENVGESITRLEKMRDSINEAILSLGKGTTELFQLVRESLLEVDELEKAIESMLELERMYARVQARTEDLRKHFRRHYPDKFSEDLNQYVFDELADTVDRFTVFENKELAGMASGLEVEEGDAEGELTLF